MAEPWRTYTTSTHNRANLQGRTGKRSGDTLGHLPALRGGLQELEIDFSQRHAVKGQVMMALN